MVEVGVAEAPDGFPVEVETACDGADGPASRDELLDVSVAVSGPVEDGCPWQFVERELHQGRCFRDATGHLVDAFTQAGAVLVAGLLHRGGEVLEQVPPVGDFHGVGRRFLDGAGVGRGPVPADDLGAWMLAQPGREGLGGTVGQDVHDSTGLHVDEDGSVGATPAEGELVDTKNPRGSLRHRRRIQQLQESRASSGEVHAAAQPFASSPTELDRDLAEPGLQTEAGAAISLAQPADLLDERLAPAPGPVTEEPPAPQSDQQLLPRQRPLGETSLIAGMHPPSPGTAPRAPGRRTARGRYHHQDLSRELHSLQPHIDVPEQHIVQRADPHQRDMPCRNVPSLGF